VVGAGDLVDHPKRIALHYLKGYFLIDLFVVFPLPQVKFFLFSFLPMEVVFILFFCTEFPHLDLVFQISICKCHPISIFELCDMFP